MTDSIRALWQTMADGWANGDAAQFASVFAADVDFVNVRGEALVGREAVEAGHAALFATAYRDTTLSAEVTLIRNLTPELSLVHAISRIAPAGVVTHAQAVVRHDGEPTIAAFHNMIGERTHRMTRPRLRHLAFVVQDAKRMAAFYCEQFGMELFHTDPDGSHFVTDGYLNLALIQQQLDGDVATGFNHFGFQVDEVAPVAERLAEAGVPRPVLRGGDRPFAEYRAIDPEGNWFDLSAHGFLPPSLSS